MANILAIVTIHGIAERADVLQLNTHVRPCIKKKISFVSGIPVQDIRVYFPRDGSNDAWFAETEDDILVLVDVCENQTLGTDAGMAFALACDIVEEIKSWAFLRSSIVATCLVRTFRNNGEASSE